MTARTMTLTLLLAAAALGWTSCSKTINQDDIQEDIGRIAREAGVQVRSVECPDDIEFKKGDSFNCAVTAQNGKKAEIKAEQLDDDGKFSVATAQFLPLRAGRDQSSSKGRRPFETTRIEQAITENVSSESNGRITASSVDCPDKVAIKAGATFTCTVTSKDGKTTEYTVTQADNQGNVRFKGNLTPLAP